MSMLGITIGPYRLEDVLGEGGMGRVYRAWDQRLERYVAVKHIRSEVAKSDLHRARFKREAWAVARLNHPSIVHIYDILENKAGDWIVMELVGGPSLRSMILRSPLDPRYAAAYGRQIAEGLVEAHAKGIVHRDLKTENVLIAPSGQAKILDFGLAKPMVRKADEKTLSVIGAVIGTCRAMSPEQAEGFAVGPASDLFSLGTLLYEVCTGISPFKDSTAMKTLAKVVSHHPEPVRELAPEVSLQLSELIARLMVKEPERRPANASLVATELAEIESNYTSSSVGPRGPVESHITLEIGPEALASAELEAPDPPLLPSSKWYSSHRLLLGIGVGLILFGLLFLFWHMRSENGKSNRGAVETASEPFIERETQLRQAERLLVRFDKPGNLEQAEELYQSLLTQEERDAEAHAGLARTYLYLYEAEKESRFLEKAARSAARSVEIDGVLASARVSLGWVYAAQNREEEAREEWTQALLFDPKEADAYAGLGYIHLKRGELNEAEKVYLNACDLDPYRLSFWQSLGEVSQRQGKLDAAAAAFERCIEIAPDSHLGYQHLAGIHAARGDLNLATETLHKGLEVQPHASLLANLGTYFLRQGYYRQAIEVLERVVAMPEGDEDPRYWGQLADAYRLSFAEDSRIEPAYDRALQGLEKEIEKQPQDQDALSYRALYLAQQGRCDEAQQDLVKLGNPLEAVLAYRMALTFNACGDRPQALSFLEKALKKGQSAIEIQQNADLNELSASRNYTDLLKRLNTAEDPSDSVR